MKIMKIFSNWKLAATVLPIVLIAIGVKTIVHILNLEVFTLSPLFSGVIGASVFLIGFMIAGTLSDFKESERLPSELAASLYSIADECSIIQNNKGKKASTKCIKILDEIAVNILLWMRSNTSSDKILERIESLNNCFAELEPYTQATYINRIKTEQNQIRRLILRMQTIRETSFVGTAYVIAEVCTLILILGLIFTKGQAFFEALFFIGFITFILTYMIALITDLDNPFNFSNELVGDEVSLKPLEQFRTRINGLMG